MREAELERRLVRGVQSRGGLTVKIAPTTAGVPDRLVIMQDRPPMLIEMKADGGRLRPVQRLWHDRARNLGTEVLVLTGREEVDHWLSLFPTV